jgi:hypothetical protein
MQQAEKRCGWSSVIWWSVWGGDGARWVECFELVGSFEQIAKSGCQVLILRCYMCVIRREKSGERVGARALNADDVNVGHVVVLESQQVVIRPLK